MNVLIVAKCIVNAIVGAIIEASVFVLIVAKCIVNERFFKELKIKNSGINSSKVYCKFL